MNKQLPWIVKKYKQLTGLRLDGKQPHVSIYNRAEQDSLKIYHISMINDILWAIDMKLNTLVASRGAALIRGTNTVLFIKQLLPWITQKLSNFMGSRNYVAYIIL